MIFTNESMRVMHTRLLIACAESFFEIFIPIFAPIKLAKSAIGMINKLISPKKSFEKKAKKAWKNTSKVIEGKRNLGSLLKKYFNAAAKSIAPPIPIEALIAPMQAKIGYNKKNNFDFLSWNVTLK